MLAPLVKVRVKQRRASVAPERNWLATKPDVWMIVVVLARAPVAVLRTTADVIGVSESFTFTFVYTWPPTLGVPSWPRKRRRLIVIGPVTPAPVKCELS